MRVSKSLIVWMFAILAAFSFAFMPAVAGDHPWNEDESGGGAGDGGEPDHGGTLPDDPFIIDPDNLENIVGTSLFWWDLIRDGLLVNDKTETVTAQTAGTQETKLTGGRKYR